MANRATKPNPAPKPVSAPAPAPKPVQSPASKPVSLKTCKEFARLTKLSNDKDQEARLKLRSASFDRGGYVGSIASIFKRAQKKGKACGKSFNAGDYPDHQHALMLPGIVPVYGFKYPTDCERTDWGDGGKFTQQANAKYEVEHILEWQLVTGSFDWMSKVYYKGKTKYDNPDPAIKTRVQFCDYWLGTFAQAPKIALSSRPGTKKTPLEYIRDEFPSKDNAYKNEFAWLEDGINAPAKAQMWANKKPNGVYGASTMEAHLKGADKTEGAILTMKLRYLVGARTYHRNKWVTDTLKKQKERIEKILGELDSELTKHIPSWQKQDFSKRWNEYMDQHFLDAEKRWDADLQKWFAKLDKVFGRIDPKQKKPGPNDDLIKTIEAVRKAWKKESAISWAKPW